MITQTINLNLIPGCPLPRINVSQYDNGSRTLQFNLYNGVSPYEIPSGASVYIVGNKADNTGFEYACTFDGSLVSVDITDQMTVFAGEVQSELRISQNGEVLGTANFIINVERAALSDDTQISETDIPIIQRIPEILAEAEEYADTAHKWATFGADTETPSSTNNAKYWAEQSQTYAAGALHWKSSVTFANIPTSGMVVGDFYNITDDFTTDSRFDEGAGVKCAAGTNIVWDTNNKWDILTPSTVASQVKYDGTTSGLSATNVQGAIDEVVSDAGAVETRVGNLETEMGSSDISAIGDGTVTGGISQLNSDLSNNVKNIKSADITVSYVGRNIAQMLSSLTSQLDYSKITPYSYAKMGSNILRPITITSTLLQLSFEVVTGSNTTILTYVCQSANNHAYKSLNNVISEISTDAGEADLTFFY